MTAPVTLVEAWRGDFLESLHQGHVAIASASGDIVEGWGNPDQLVFPRSAIKMIQALPLIESGAADSAGLTDEHLALSCASHNGARIHTDRIKAWLEAIGKGDDDFRCGTQLPDDRQARTEMICSDQTPCRIHNNCSGKHSGFLTLTRHLGAGPEYVEVDHPVQLAVREAFEETTGETSPGYGIDGCSAPNFVSTLGGVARAMARFAVAAKDGDDGSSPRARAMSRLTAAMSRHPDLVAGEGRACTRLMRAMDGKVAVKTGAEGVFTAIIPEQGIGIALKISDGATRASEATIVALLIRLGVLDANHPVAKDYFNAAITDRRGAVVGRYKSTI